LPNRTKDANGNWKADKEDEIMTYQNETEEQHIERLYQNWVKEQEEKAKRQLQDVKKRQRELEAFGMPTKTAESLVAGEILANKIPLRPQPKGMSQIEECERAHVTLCPRPNCFYYNICSVRKR
jgi:hypothetical protein